MWVLLSSGFIPRVPNALDFPINSSCDLLATFSLTMSFFVVIAGWPVNWYQSCTNKKDNIAYFPWVF